MADIALCFDVNNRSEDQKNLEYMAGKFESTGHTVKKVGVGPGLLQGFGLSSSSTGYTAVMCCNGADLQTYKDFYLGIKNGYYHFKYCYFGLEGWISPTTCSCEGAKTAKLKKAHDDYSSSSFTADIVGMTTAQVMKKYKECISYACGSSIEELTKNLLKVIGGGDMDEDGESSASTIKDAIKEVLSIWDGDVEAYVRDDTFYVQKIDNPYDNADDILKVLEGFNIIDDSVSITDVNPDTINFLTVHWEGGEDIIIKDELLISRFGEKKKEVDAVKYISTISESTDDTSSDEDDADTTSDDEESSSSVTVEEVPITTYGEAANFANIEWGKCKRDNGHSIELKVVSSEKFKQGEWVAVYIPSFGEVNIDGKAKAMYINKCNHSESDSGWATDLTLVDYPPGFGEYDPTSNDEDEEEEDVELEDEEEEI